MVSAIFRRKALDGLPRQGTGDMERQGTKENTGQREEVASPLDGFQPLPCLHRKGNRGGGEGHGVTETVATLCHSGSFHSMPCS